MNETDERKELRLIRKRIGLTQAAMAVRLNVSQSAYEKYERGERGIPAALLEKAQSLQKEYETGKRIALELAECARMAAEVKKRRFEGWIQGCWMLFFVSAAWLVLRIAVLQVGADFLRLGPNDEALGMGVSESLCI
ncbi:helix-turn-helix domain-containing protein [Pseudogemmobacter faecipullorum]|uniref:Helix-turn-helix transcriptional regulator n=1 Tax=Pseudogemmobacter faecipullorum TaxID=2755041 RepID=A0ABS8CSR1_9RHOB|nr:helix-turn-helix transcriptional regulator [Pseudogemmobacter faecipullorum]MCB5412444.1 helix-turn-helix transcriptional regulator [Pseudogemmobacter faecipullorum]